MVSVIIPVYNSELFLRETLDSVLEQTYQNIEIIIIDDGSRDKSQDIIEEYLSENQNIQLVKSENCGSPSAKNKGLAIAKGEYIQFLDSDDILSRDKISNQVELLRNTPNAICVCRTKVFKRMDDLLSIDLLPEIDSDALSFSSNPLDFQLNLLGYYDERFKMIQPNAFLIPRSLIEVAGYWSEELNRSPDDDSEFFMRVILNSQMVVYDERSWNFYRKSLNILSRSNNLINCIGALRTIELKYNYLIKLRDDSKIRNIFAIQMSTVAYHYSSHQFQIVQLTKVALNNIGFHQFVVVGGKNFVSFAGITGFEFALRLKYILSKIYLSKKMFN